MQIGRTNEAAVSQMVKGDGMKKQAFFLPVMVLLCISFLWAQDMNQGTLNTYEEEGATGLGAPPPAKPEKKKQAAPVRSAPAVRSSDEPENTGSGEAGEDEHFIQSDDYFISDDAFTTQSWIWVHLAKVATPPSAATKREGEFMKIRDGNKAWTKNYYKTMIANKSNLKLGTVVISFNDNNQNDIYSAPDTKENSRGGSWFMGKIIDMTDVYKGYVTVAGNYKVSPKNIRIIVK
jgi:hypothetical protein